MNSTDVFSLEFVSTEHLAAEAQDLKRKCEVLHAEMKFYGSSHNYYMRWKTERDSMAYRRKKILKVLQDRQLRLFD